MSPGPLPASARVRSGAGGREGSTFRRAANPVDIAPRLERGTALVKFTAEALGPDGRPAVGDDVASGKVRVAYARGKARPPDGG